MIIKKIIKEGQEGIVFILGPDDTKKLRLLLADGTQAQIQFDVAKVQEDKLFTDPLKGLQDHTKKAIVELVHRFGTSEFKTDQFLDVRKKYYAPALTETLKKFEKKNLISIKPLNRNTTLFQFSEQLCRHFGN
jgi:hypothetical protein